MTTVYHSTPDAIVYRAILLDEPHLPVPIEAEVRVGSSYTSPIVGLATDFRKHANGMLSAKLTLDCEKYEAELPKVQEGVSLYAGEFKIVGPA